jgi:hypothetical protein
MSDDELVASLTEWQRGYLFGKAASERGVLYLGGCFDPVQWGELLKLGLVDTHAMLTEHGRAVVEAVRECEAVTCVLQRAERRARGEDHR